MNEPISRSLVVLGASILLAFNALGYLIGNAAIDVKRFDQAKAKAAGEGKLLFVDILTDG